MILTVLLALVKNVNPVVVQKLIAISVLDQNAGTAVVVKKSIVKTALQMKELSVMTVVSKNVLMTSIVNPVPERHTALNVVQLLFQLVKKLIAMSVLEQIVVIAALVIKLLNQHLISVILAKKILKETSVVNAAHHHQFHPQFQAHQCHPQSQQYLQITQQNLQKQYLLYLVSQLIHH